MSAPFRVIPSVITPGRWVLWMRTPLLHKGTFNTQGEAIDHAYRNWPWYL